jgi:hypothetical protein
LGHATGEYVTYLTDKMVVFPHALSDVDAVIRATGADIVNWATALYYLDDSEAPLGSGNLVEEYEFLDGHPEEYDPIGALRYKANGAVPRTKQGTKDYALGKIVFGCFSQELIDRIRSKSGTVFGGATHDYSAMIQALSLARTCVMLNAYEAIFFSLPREQSLGSAVGTEPQRALEYYRTFTSPESVLSALLVPYVYASPHNMVAHDYVKFLPMYGNGDLFNERNWLRAIHADLLSESTIWLNSAERDAQVGLLRRRVGRRYLVGTRLRRLVAESQARIKRLRNRVMRRNVTAKATYQEFSATSLEQAMDHVVTQGRQARIAGVRQG